MTYRTDKPGAGGQQDGHVVSTRLHWGRDLPVCGEGLLPQPTVSVQDQHPLLHHGEGLGGSARWSSRKAAVHAGEELDPNLHIMDLLQ